MGFDFVEEQIRLATERGDFDNLPGSGKPIEGLSSTYDPNWWAREFLKRLTDEDKNRERSAELERKLARVWGLDSAAKVRTAVRDLNAEAGSETFDVETVLASWRKFRATIRPRGKPTPGVR